jgi:RNase P/RNase MRP subunit p29
MFKDILIGEYVLITYNGKNYEGIIVDETKNTIILKTNKKKITLLKKSSTIKISNKTIQGKDIIKRPEERIK